MLRVSQRHDKFYKRLGGVFPELSKQREIGKQCLPDKWEFVVESDYKSQKEKVKIGPLKSLIIGTKNK